MSNETTAGAGQTVDTTTSQGVTIFLTQQLAKANGDAQKIDKAYRDAQVMAQRLSGVDKGKEWLLKALDKRSEVFNNLVQIYQDLSKRAADSTVENDQKTIQHIIDLISKQQSTNFNLDLSPEQAKSGMYSMAGALAALCELCGFQQGADYLNEKIATWKNNNQVSVSTDGLEALLGKLSPKTEEAQKLILGGSDAAMRVFRENVDNVLKEQMDTYYGGVSGAPASGAMTGAPVGGNAPTSVTPEAAPAPAAAASAATAAQLVIKKAAVESKIDGDKIAALTKVYANAAGADGLLDADEAKTFMAAPVVKQLQPDQLQNIQKALVLRHMAIEGSFTK